MSGIGRHRLGIQERLDAPNASGPPSNGNDAGREPPSQSPSVVGFRGAAMIPAPESALGRLIRSEFSPNEFPTLIEAVLTYKDVGDRIRYLSTEDAQAFVDVVDEALDKTVLQQGVREKCLKQLYRACGCHALLPKALKVPVCFDRTGIALYRGGHADVWKGEYRDMKVAVKVMRLYSNSDLQKVVGRFCKEVVTWKDLRHPNILPLIGVTMSEGLFAMVSEWMVNGNINEFLRAHPGADRLELLREVARGMIYIHQRRMIHGDLKGANILIDQTRHARLADFGLLTIISDPANVLSSSSYIPGGTARWMGPELIAPQEFGLKTSHPTKSSDCYSLGMVVYETVSGHLPFHQDTDLSVFVKVLKGDRPRRGPGFTESLWKMLGRCWEAQPGDRPSVEDVLQCLEMGQTPPVLAPRSKNLNAKASEFKSTGRPLFAVSSNQSSLPLALRTEIPSLESRILGSTSASSNLATAMPFNPDLLHLTRGATHDSAFRSPVRSINDKDDLPGPSTSIASILHPPHPVDLLTGRSVRTNSQSLQGPDQVQPTRNSVGSVRVAPDLQRENFASMAVGNTMSTSSSGNKVCKDFLAGGCLRVDCPFDHDFGRALCQYWLRGKCIKGERCKFSHSLPSNTDVDGIVIVMARSDLNKPLDMMNGDIKNTKEYGSQVHDDTGRTRLANVTRKPNVAPHNEPTPATSRRDTGPVRDDDGRGSAVVVPRPFPRLKLRHPTLLPNFPTGESAVMYANYMSQTSELEAVRDACLSRAADAWRRGDSISAKRFREEGQELTVRMNVEMAGLACQLVKERAKLAERVVRGRDTAWSDDPGDRTNSGKIIGDGLGVCLGVARVDVGGTEELSPEERTEAVVDLRGLHANGGTEVLELFFIGLERERFCGLVFAIVGEGECAGAKNAARDAFNARLAAGVREWLHMRGYPWIECDNCIICVDPLTHTRRPDVTP